MPKGVRIGCPRKSRSSTKTHTGRNISEGQGSPPSFLTREQLRDGRTLSDYNMQEGALIASTRKQLEDGCTLPDYTIQISYEEDEKFKYSEIK